MVDEAPGGPVKLKGVAMIVCVGEVSLRHTGRRATVSHASSPPLPSEEPDATGSTAGVCGKRPPYTGRATMSDGMLLIVSNRTQANAMLPRLSVATCGRDWR